jgi:hypothetical protein
MRPKYLPRTENFVFHVSVPDGYVECVHGTSMADLKKDLDNYLSRNDNKSQLKITMPALLSKPDVGKWFTKSASNEDTSAAWLSEAQKDCCPSLVTTCNNTLCIKRYFALIMNYNGISVYLPFQSRIQRIIGFCLCIMLGLLCFVLAAMYTPVLLLKARKFALLYTMGSLFTICRYV